MIKSEMKNLLLKITIKVLKITLAIEKNNKYENQQII
jgi:hypothetical protein